MSAFDRLIQQIDAFIRKYYKNELIKGVVLFVGFLFASWLVVSTLEYFGRFNSAVRLGLLLSFIGINGFILLRYFIKPLGQLYAFGTRINRAQAAQIIGTFFPTISDRLLNTLQLNEVANPDDRSYELLSASVAQRSKELTAVPFVDAVRFQELRKYLKFVIPIVLLFTSVFVFAPALIIDGSSNVVNYNQAQKAPFDFSLASDLLAINEGDSFDAAVIMSGAYIPEQVYIVSDRGRFLMKHTRKNRLSYVFDNMKVGMNFHFESEGYRSSDFHINVIGKSSLGKVVAVLNYPKYLNRKSEIVSNVAELDLPEGTVVKWKVAAKNVRSLKVKWLDSLRVFQGTDASFTKRYISSGLLNIFMQNAVTAKEDSSSIQIKVVKDAYPSILVNESIDSINPAVRSFAGLLSDDYGLNNLTFFYTINKKNGKQIVRRMNVQKISGTSDKFSFAVDFSREDLDVEDKITYHFSVSDNDGVNGPKSTQSQSFVYELPTLTDLNNKRDETQKELQNALSDVLKKTDEFQKEVNRLQKSLMNKSKSDFKSLEQVQQLKQEQQSLQNELQDIQDKLQQSNEEKNELTEQDEELLKQQELIEELLKEVMDEELMKLLNDLEEMMKKNDQQQMKEDSEKLDQSSEDMKKQLDRTLEMLKRLQVNEKIDGLEKELNELAKEQEDLKKDIEDQQISKEGAERKQDEINKAFEDIKKDMDELKKLNEELARPMDIGDFKESQEEIQKELNEAKDKISSGKPSKAGQNQKSAADKMKEMSEQLEKQQAEANKKQNEEDMGLIRLLLENLMALSFDQEHNMQAFTAVKDTDPLYRKLGRRQRGIMDDTKVVEDSLMALAKRQPKIASFIDKELKSIRSNYGLIVDDVDEHRRRDLSAHQQLVMTSINNLALLLNESLQSMQQQQQAQSKQSGSGSCDNPGGAGKKPSDGQMSSEDMKEMLKKQMEQMKKGPNPGGKSPGNKSGQGNQGMPGLGNKEIAKMAAQQTAIRQRLEQMRNEMNKQGQGKGNQLNPLIKELEQQERDLINKNFSQEMVKRQQEILTRLLESEKALKERGFEEKRESKAGKDQNYGNLIRFDEYNRQKLGQIELLRSVDPLLSRYYKDKASQYFNRAL